MPPVTDPLRRYQLYVAMFLLNLAIVVGIVYLLRREEPRAIIVTQPSRPAASPAAPISVSVNGAVKHPGTVKLAVGARLADALQSAGGVLPDADLSKLDLTLVLKDGDKISISSASGVPPAANNPVAATAQPIANQLVTQPTAAPPAPSEGDKLNLNTATLAELDELPGIGPALAQRILDYRAEKGSFKSVEELMDVRGIGEGLFGDLRDLVTVE